MWLGSVSKLNFVGAMLRGLPEGALSVLNVTRNRKVASGSGEIREIATVTDTGITVLSRVTGEYYLLLLLAREGNLGRGRFELRKAAAALEKELL